MIDSLSYSLRSFEAIVTRGLKFQRYQQMPSVEISGRSLMLPVLNLVQLIAAARLENGQRAVESATQAPV